MDGFDTKAAVDAYLALDTPAQQMRRSVLAVADTLPDKEAEYRRDALRAGLPVDTVRNAPDETRRALLSQFGYEQFAKDFPSTARFMGQADNARLSHDDTDTLSGFEKALRMPWQGVQAVASGIPSLAAGFYGLGAAPFELASQFVGQPLTRLRVLPEDIFGKVGAGFRRASQIESEYAKRVADVPPDAGLVHRSVVSGLQSFSQNVPFMAAGLATGNAALAVGGMSAIQGGTSYVEARDKGLTPAGAFAYGARDAAIEAATEAFSFGRLLRDVKVGTPFLKMFISNQVREQLGEQAATVLQDYNEWATLHPEKPFKDSLDARPSAALQTAIATAVAGGAHVGLARVVQKELGYLEQAERKRQESEAVTAALKAASESRLRERAPDTFQQFVAEVTRDGPMEAVYVNPATFMQEVARAGLDLATMPQTAAAVQEAQTTGTDARVPFAELAAGLPGTGLENTLPAHFRTDPNGPTFAETRDQKWVEETQAHVQKVMAEQEFTTAWRDATATVQGEILAQLEQAKRFSGDVNKSYAAAMAAFYATNAQRLGITPDQMYVRYPLRIESVVRTDRGSGSVLWQDANNHAIQDLTTPGSLYDATQLTALRRSAARIEAPEKGVYLLVNENGTALATGPKGLKVPKAIVDFAQREGLTLYTARAGSSERLTPQPISSTGNLPATIRATSPMPLNYRESGARYHVEFGTPYGVQPAGRFFQPAGWDSVDTSDPTSPDPLKPGIGSRGMISFGNNIQRDPSVITLFEGANLSTFLHESGHFYLEVLNDMASQPDTPAEIVADMNKVLAWFGVAPDSWQAMTLEEKRPYHEQWARGFEAYLFEGKSPSTELQGLFQRFRAWMVSLYRQVKALNVTLTDDVRGVMDRLVATTEQITEAEDARRMGALFETKPEGMDESAWREYQALSEQATQDAVDNLQTRGLRDMKWISNAKSRLLKIYRRDAREKRHEARIDARREVFTEPRYQAWQFLTHKSEDSDNPNKPKVSDTLNPSTDTLFTAIAKLGGVDQSEAVQRWGIDPADIKHIKGEGTRKPVLPAKGGKSIDAMLEELAQYGYLELDVNGKADERQLEDLFGMERIGEPQYSRQADYNTIHGGRFGPQTDAEAMADVENGKLDTNILKVWYGTDPTAEWRKLTNLGMTSTTNGMHPDMIAAKFGMQSGDELVRALLGAEPPKMAVDGVADRLMLERHGDLVDARALENAANAAIHNEARARMLATQQAALDKAVGNKTVLTKAAKEQADRIIGGQVVKRITPSKYEAAASRAGREAAKSFKNNDIQAAAVHNRNQLLNTYAAKAAHEAEAEIKDAVRGLRNIFRGDAASIAKRGRDPDLVMAARAVLSRYGIGGEAAGKTAQEYLAVLRERDPGMYDALKDRVDVLTANGKDYRELTVDEFRALRDEVTAMMFLAKRSRQMEVDGDLLDRQDVQAEIRARLAEIDKSGKSLGADHAVTPAEKRGMLLATARASLRRVESWVNAMDGLVPVGAFRKYIWQPVKDAADRYNKARIESVKEIRGLVTRIAPTLAPMRIHSPELGYTFGYAEGGSGVAEILHAILHTGNASNKRKLLLGGRPGNPWATENPDGTLDTTKWDAFIQRMIAEGRLTKQHFDFVQGVWDVFERTKVLAQKTHRDVFGFYFKEITAEPFTITLPKAAGTRTVDGQTVQIAAGTETVTYRGGYAPAIADSDIVPDAQMRDLAEAENKTLAYAFPATQKGFTISRVEYNRPLKLDLRLLTQHMDKVLLFSHLEAPIRDVRRVLSSRGVASALFRVDAAAMSSMLTPWLNRTARQQVETPVPGSGGLMRFFTAARRNTGMALMFANVSNAVQQGTGMLSALVKVDAGQLTRAMALYARSPSDFTANVASSSVYMENRLANEIANITGEINEILLNPSALEKAQDWTRKHAYFLQTAVDSVISPVVWTAAYNQHVEAGLPHKDAVRLADGAVRETQGANAAEDIARFETGNAIMRLLTQFAGYFNTQANMLGTEFVKVARDMGWRSGAGRAFYVFLFGFLAPAWVAAAIAELFRGGPDDEDKDGEYLDDWLFKVFGMAPVKMGTAMVPGFGPMVNAGINSWNSKPYDDRMSLSPVVSVLEAGAGAGTKVYKAIAEDGKPSGAIRDVATATSALLGVPVVAVGKPLGYAADVQAGRVAPTSNYDMARGLITGTASPPSKQ